MMPLRAWPRLRARWTDSHDASLASVPDALAYQLVGGQRGLFLAPGSSSPTAEPGWVPFALRHRYAGDRASELVNPRYLLVVRAWADEPTRTDFRRWLDEEHCRLQLTLPGVHWYLGYEEEGSNHSFLNLWGIDEPDIVDGGDWARVRDTPWWARVAHVPAAGDRGVYRRAAAREGDASPAG